MKPELVARMGALAASHIIALTGLLVLSRITFGFDHWPLFALAVVGYVALVLAVAPGNDWSWLVVGGVWIYAAIIVAEREDTAAHRWGYLLVFLGLGVSALATYLAHDWRKRVER